MIDWSRVDTLRAEVGEDEFEEVVELFLEEVDSVIQRLKEEPGIETLGEDLHFLKGSALSLGFQEFSKLCQSGESYAAQGKPQIVDMPALFACFDSSRQAFLSDLPGKLAGQPHTSL